MALVTLDTTRNRNAMSQRDGNGGASVVNSKSTKPSEPSAKPATTTPTTTPTVKAPTYEPPATKPASVNPNAQYREQWKAMPEAVKTALTTEHASAIGLNTPSSAPSSAPSSGSSSSGGASSPSSEPYDLDAILQSIGLMIDDRVGQALSADREKANADLASVLAEYVKPPAEATPSIVPELAEIYRGNNEKALSQSQALSDQIYQKADDLIARYGDLYDDQKSFNPLGTDWGKTLLDYYGVKSGSDAKAATGAYAIDNGGNVDSYAAANGARQRLSTLNQGVSAISGMSQDRFNNMLSTLQSIGVDTANLFDIERQNVSDSFANAQHSGALLGDAYGTDKAVEAEKAASYNDLIASIYGDTASKEATEHASDNELAGTIYATDAEKETAKYATDAEALLARLGYDTEKYVADRELEGTKYAADTETTIATLPYEYPTANYTVEIGEDDILGWAKEMGLTKDTTEDDFVAAVVESLKDYANEGLLSAWAKKAHQALVAEKAE